ncbi:MAG: CPBP family intramembrane glutamic endopeptidase [Anaerolineae bacterium]
MAIPLQTIILCLPSAIYVLVQHWRGRPWASALALVGWRGSNVRYLGVGLALGLIPGLLLLALPNILPPELANNPNIANSRYAGWPATPASFVLAWGYEAIYVALGEEAFFRGFLGGLLMRRLGFALGNLLQAAIFLLPHLLLLTVSTALWPLLAAQFLAGWLQGWLLYRSGSILPGWIAHSLGNAFGALAFMV